MGFLGNLVASFFEATNPTIPDSENPYTQKAREKTDRELAALETARRRSVQNPPKFPEYVETVRGQVVEDEPVRKRKPFDFWSLNPERGENCFVYHNGNQTLKHEIIDGVHVFSEIYGRRQRVVDRKDTPEDAVEFVKNWKGG